MLDRIINQVNPGIDYLFYDFLILLAFLIIVIIVGIIIAVLLIKKRNGEKKSDHSNYLNDIVSENNIASKKQEQNKQTIKILKERLAKGEITKKEYDELKKEFES